MNKDSKIIFIALTIMCLFIGIFSYFEIQHRHVDIEKKINLWSCVKEGYCHSPDIITDNLLDTNYLIRNKTQLILTKESICN